MPQDKYDLSKFDKEFVQDRYLYATGSLTSGDPIIGKLKQYITFKLDTEIKKANKELIERIKNIKKTVRKEQGAYKYDWCYDDCIKIIESYIKKQSNKKSTGFLRDKL
jgi:hypothetical protein